MDNPFAKYVTDAAPQAENPFARYATQDGAPAETPPTPAEIKAQKTVDDEGDIDYATRNFNKGLPFGSYIDEGVAGAKALGSVVSGGRIGDTYENALALEHARDKAAAKAYSRVVGTLPLVGDVTTGGLLSLGGSIASAPLAPGLKVMQGATMLPKMVNSAATGLAYGGFYGSGDDSGKGRFDNAAKMATIGGLLGVAAPPVATVAGNIAGGLVDAARPMPNALKGRAPEAIKNIGAAVEADKPFFDGRSFGANTHGTGGGGVMLGNEGMVADLGPTLRAHASGLAARPDTTALITEPLLERSAVAPDRANQSIDTAFGKPQNLPEYIEQTKNAANAAAKPYYDTFHATSVPVDKELGEILSDIKGALPGAVSSAEKLARGDGHRIQFKLSQINEPMTPLTGIGKTKAEQVPTGLEYDYLKRAVDNSARAQKQGSNEQRIYANLARNLRTAVDTRLNPSDPGQSSWAMGRKISEPGFDIKQAVQDGRDAMQRGADPDQIAYDMKGDSRVETQGKMIGARGYMRQAMGTKATAFGPKGDTAARQMFNSDFGQQKIDLFAKPGKGQQLKDRIAAENVMAKTADEVLGNSATARRLEVNKLYPNSQDKTTMHNVTVEGLVFGPAKKVVDVLTQNAITEKNIKIATDAAKMLVAQGAEKDAIVAGLLHYKRTGTMSNKLRVAVTRIANTLLHGSIAPIGAQKAMQQSAPAP